MKIKTVAQCTLDEVLKAWNKGFEGYFIEINMTAEMFLQRLVGRAYLLSILLSFLIKRNRLPL